MRILHLSSEFPPQSVYGLGRYVSELARAQRILGHEVEVITNSLSGKDFESQVSGITVKRVHFPPPPKAPATSSMLLHFNLQLMERVLESREAHYDIVNAHDWLTVPAGFHCARILGAPLITTLHDIIFNKVRGRDFGPEDAYVAGIENWAVHVSAKTILLSDCVRAETLAHYHAQPGRLAMIPGGVALTPVDSSDLESIGAWRSKLTPADENLILYVGRLDPEKGLQTLFKALLNLMNNIAHPDWKLALAGTGVLKESLETFTREHGLTNHVTFLGYVPFEELRMAYAAADLVVVPSEYEPFGLVALEAQRIGTPVLVSHTGGLAETLKLTGGGLSFECGNAEHLAAGLQRLLSDIDLRSNLGKRGQENVGRIFAWDSLAREIVAVYEAAAREGPPQNIIPPDWQSPSNEGQGSGQILKSDLKSALKTPPTLINELTLFWDTAFMPQLEDILKPLISAHALNSLNGKINVIPAIGPNSDATPWQAPLQTDRVKYISVSSDSDMKEAIKNSAALIVDARLAQPLLKIGLVVPPLIPTFWIGAKNKADSGGRNVSSTADLYTLISKVLCDNDFRRNIAPQLFNPIPSITWSSPETRAIPMVVHVLPQLVTGGAETVLLDLVKGLQSFCGHEILCLGPLEGPLPDEFRKAGAKITQFSSDATESITHYLKDKRPDILHLHSMSYVPDWMRIHRQIQNVPIIETEHVVNIGSGHFGRVDTVICVSKATQKVHEQYFPVWREGGSNFEVIYNGINLDDFASLPTKQEARNRLNLPDDRPIIGRVSALARNKLPQEALEIIPHVLKLVPDALFVIVGDGPQRKPAEAWISEKGLSNSMIFLGERRDIPQVLRAFDVFAYYTTKDALGNVILEAVAAGVPIVTTDVEGTTEALGNAPGAAVKLGDYDAFAAAIHQWIETVRLGRTSPFDLPKMFSRTAMVDSYTHIYKRLLNRSPEPTKSGVAIESRQQKLVTVLMPVYNARKEWMLEALASIKSQTFPSWQLLIVDDGSDVAFNAWLTNQIATDVGLKDRTAIIRVETNKGVAEALNFGLEHCNTDLVARMDADDRMFPDRLALQVAAFQHCPELKVLGGWAELIDVSGHPLNGRYSYPCGHRQIIKMLGSSCAFAHPTVMYRRSAVLEVGGYKPECRHFEDYDLWVRMAEAGHQFANLSSPVLAYRIHPDSISKTYQNQQGQGATNCAVRAKALSRTAHASRRPRVLFTGVYHSYGIPGRGLSIEQFFFARALEHMIDIEFHRLPADELIREHGQERAGEILIARANESGADMVFTVLGNPELDFLGKHIQSLTDSGILTLNWNCDDQWRLPQTAVWAEYYSHMVTTDPKALAHFQKIGFEKKAILSQWACNPFDYSPSSVVKDIDVSFFGQPYGNRPAMIKALNDSGINVVVHGAGWRDGKEVDFGQMIDILRRSKIVLNFSRATQGDRRQIKARFFEIPACGSFMLTEYADGMDDYLQRNRHFDTFESEKELVEKVRHWLVASERDSSTLEASSIVRSIHTYPRRLQEIFEVTGLYDRT